MSIKSLPDLYKVGSTWVFVLTRKIKSTGAPVVLTGQTVRAMFREGSVNGVALVTLQEGQGLALSASDGQVTMTLSAEQSVLFTPGSKVWFDVEMTAMDGFVWQSDTYNFKTQAEVTRD